MEAVISAISGEILSRFISFRINKRTDSRCVEEKLERLQLLLLRIHTIVEEAEGRYITNSKMLLQLRMLVDAMYQGYYVLDAFRFIPFEEISNEKQVTISSSLSTPLKRTRSLFTRTTSYSDELQVTVDKLETVVANMTEFVILLGGCNQMHRRPYDTYLYIDNFMFSRLVEKQKLINALLQDNSVGNPDVIPGIGSYRTGKKSLVEFACNYDAVRSHFSSVLHLRGNSFSKVSQETFMHVRTLVVVELDSDVDDSEWVKFYGATSHVAAGSKIIVISRFQNISRLGTVEPILIKNLSHAEFTYLFKVLSFGSVNPENHPQLASIATELAINVDGHSSLKNRQNTCPYASKKINVDGLLLGANMLADLLRKNQNLQFWLHILKRFRNSLERNFTKFGEHPKQLLETDRPTDITMLIPSTCGPVHLMPSYEDSCFSKKELNKLKFGDLVAGSITVLPEEEFQIVIWESRIPPYTKFVANCIKYEQLCNLSDHKRRKWPYVTRM